MIERPSHVTNTYELVTAHSLRCQRNSPSIAHTESFTGTPQVIVVVQNHGCEFQLTVEEGLERCVDVVPKGASVRLGFSAVADEQFPWSFRMRLDRPADGDAPGPGNDLRARVEFFQVKPKPKETPAQTPAVGTSGQAAARVHVVRPGDSLWKIAQQFLGDGTKWSKIYDANKTAIGPNPDMLRPGQRLTIP
jgi:hypothetical protein